VQESLTNAARHAAGAPVRVRLSWGPGELGVEVQNPPPRQLRRRRETFGRGGVGLMGLAERVASVGGQLTAGPSDGDGFAVRATFALCPETVPVVKPAADDRVRRVPSGVERD
jgi:signal transduction histidine kinase